MNLKDMESGLYRALDKPTNRFRGTKGLSSVDVDTDHEDWHVLSYISVVRSGLMSNTGTTEKLKTKNDVAPLADSDEFYSALLIAHRDLDIDQSTTLNARLVLLLANEIGDLERVKTIVQLAKTVEPYKH